MTMTTESEVREGIPTTEEIIHEAKGRAEIFGRNPSRDTLCIRITEADRVHLATLFHTNRWLWRINWFLIGALGLIGLYLLTNMIESRLWVDFYHHHDRTNSKQRHQFAEKVY